MEDLTEKQQEQDTEASPKTTASKAPRPPKLRKKTYQSNPFLEDAFPLVKTKTKRITNNKGGYLIKSDDGEVVDQVAGFWTAKQVDSTQFIKLYVNGVKAFSDLSTKGAKVFELMYYEIQNSIGKDKIYLNFATTEKEKLKISKTTFYDGLNELVEKKFLAPAEATHWFWLNPDYLWNGDRLTFVQTFIKQKTSKIDVATGDLFPEDLLGFGDSEAQD